MIRLQRADEPPDLVRARTAALPRIVQLSAERSLRANDFTGYGAARESLLDLQGRKCCYCEKRIEQGDPVEHFRPKTEALRGGGLPTYGYWWLAWTWSNLFVACGQCNRRKGTDFPLAPGSVPLAPLEEPPGGEIPLLIDPAVLDPMDHVCFRPMQSGQWHPFPRRGSEVGRETIVRLGLNRPGLLSDYREHVNRHVRPLAEGVRTVMRNAGPRDARAVLKSWSNMVRSLLRRANVFAALSHDALDHLIPAEQREQWRLVLPRPPVDERRSLTR